MSARRQALVEDLLPRLAVPEAGPIDLVSLLPGMQRYGLELGFGGGEHLVGQALKDTSFGVIGAEPFTEGVGKALGLIDDSGVTNVRLHAGDGRAVLERLPDGVLNAIYVLFPDPWPKVRHHKRRLIQPELIAHCARALQAGGRLRVASDVQSYVAWTLLHVRANPAFAWTARRASDWRTPSTDHITTRYEAKNIGDCPPTFLDFVRV